MDGLAMAMKRPLQRGAATTLTNTPESVISLVDELTKH